MAKIILVQCSSDGDQLLPDLQKKLPEAIAVSGINRTILYAVHSAADQELELLITFRKALRLQPFKIAEELPETIRYRMRKVVVI